MNAQNTISRSTIAKVLGLGSKLTHLTQRLNNDQAFVACEEIAKSTSIALGRIEKVIATPDKMARLETLTLAVTEPASDEAVVIKTSTKK